MIRRSEFEFPVAAACGGQTRGPGGATTRLYNSDVARAQRYFIDYTLK